MKQELKEQLDQIEKKMTRLENSSKMETKRLKKWKVISDEIFICLLLILFFLLLGDGFGWW